ncbi:hypothetical protein [Polaribacter sp. IC073]|uniref:hypothetical protein n=1 Tax=Polaribacter sp. IC073 TaxID=2508540 RepID=UPI0011BD6DEE|nr:hypothetical protein [Polaribacter sp. IC073]TXD45978.1 hypothetical protein ES045_15410 [Polaribacter sp. IC073]
MKRYIILLIVLITQLFCNEVFSQSSATYSSDKKVINSQNNLIPNNNYLTTIAQLNISSGANEVVLNQYGLNNVAEIYQSKQTAQSVVQIGIENYYGFVDYENSSPVNFNVLQQGNANSLQIYGTNSLINGMEIIQKSNFKNIVIRNYR